MTATGRLFIAATPIGNLKDWSLRAIETAKAVDIIACEDTRVTGVLLHHYQIKKPLLSYHDHNGEEARPRMLAELRSGKQIMLVSDAGTPLISDPGYKLVREAQAQKIPVVALPGASSVTAALSISGLPTDRFVFLGFLPPKEGARKQVLEQWKHVPATLVLFETARRLPEVMSSITATLGNREVAVAREISKAFESVVRDSAENIMGHFTAENLRGEIVLLIAPPEEETPLETLALEKILRPLVAHLSVKDAAAVAAEITGLSKKETYQCALGLKHDR